MPKKGNFLLSFAKKTKKGLLDILFPINCLGCGREGLWICPACFLEIKLLDFQFCPCCEKYITEKGNLCPSCKKSKKSHLNSLIAAVSYEDPAVKKLIHFLKYRFAAKSSLPLSELIIKSLTKNDQPLPDLIVPVPLNKRRLRWRGFNQSLLLAENISQNLAPPLKIETADILARTRHNRPQMEISNYQRRLGNVRGIFSLNGQLGKNYFYKKSVLLVDDIATTGATLEECAKVLKENGAKHVHAAVIARQTFHSVK